MPAHLLLRLEAPLVSFGGVAIDNRGVTDAWPSASLLAGLLGNALGYQRTDDVSLQSLQDRLVFACGLVAKGEGEKIIELAGERIVDFQTADLEHADKGWTTRGAPEGRAGGAKSYEGKHIRYRHFWANRVVLAALRLDPDRDDPTLDAVETALRRPARPLFIGRKPCIPSAPILAGRLESSDPLAALIAWPATEGESLGRSVFAPAAMAAPDRFAAGNYRDVRVHGQRNWTSGVHGGFEMWREGVLAGEASS